MLINYNAITDVIRSLMHVPIASLVNDERILRVAVGTGEDQSLFLTRRYSFMRPKLEYSVSEDKSLVSLNLVYGMGAKTTLMTTERQVIEDTEITVFVSDSEQPLSAIEDDLVSQLDMQGYKFPPEVRDLKIKTFLTDKSPYSFKTEVVYDTLSLYCRAKVNVMLNYITLKDCIEQTCEHLIREGILDEQDTAGIYHLHDDPTDVPIAYRFKEYLTNQPALGTQRSGISSATQG